MFKVFYRLTTISSQIDVTSQRLWFTSTPVKQLKKAEPRREQFTSILSHITKVQSPEEQPYVKKNEAGQRVRLGVEAVKVHQHPIRRCIRAEPRGAAICEEK